MCELKNTGRSTFGNGADKPAIDEIEASYRISEEKSLFVKFKSERSMLHALNANSDEQLFHYANGKKVKVHISLAQDKICYVRIYDLLPEAPDQEIVAMMSKYGRIKRIMREKFPAELDIPAYTGVRGAYMEVKQEIPSSLYFASRKRNIYYEGNKDKCLMCKEEGHLMASCLKRKVRTQSKIRRQVKDSQAVTYVSAVAGTTNSGGLEAQGEVGEESQEAAVITADTETREMDPRDRALMLFTEYITSEINKQKAKEQKEEAKLKSAPRKKKNHSLYRR